MYCQTHAGPKFPSQSKRRAAGPASTIILVACLSEHSDYVGGVLTSLDRAVSLL